MLSIEVALVLLQIFMWTSGIGLVIGFSLAFWKNKIVSAIGKFFLILVILSVIGMCVIVFTMSSQREQTIETNEVITDVSFDEIYRAYKENELRADDTYKNNRYRITAKINGMATGGLLNMTGGATLTMEKQVGKTIVVFYAEFEKEQEDNLKQINVGDTITFEGTCLSAGTWTECELIIE